MVTKTETEIINFSSFSVELKSSNENYFMKLNWIVSWIINVRTDVKMKLKH